MYREHTIGVVVPAYNEEGFVGDVIREMPAFVDRIYVVDDRSTDRTWDEITASARADATDWNRSDGTYGDGLATADGGAVGGSAETAPVDSISDTLERRASVHDPIGRVVPIRHRENRGAGGAILTGYLAALDGGSEITVTVDGDGQMDLSQMPKLLDPVVEGADYAKGNRLLSAEYRAEMPPFRFVGNSVLSLLTKIASGYWKVSDPQNGYTAISRHALETIAVEELYEYYGYCNDLLVTLNANRMRVADVAIPSVYGEEESGITYRTYIPKVSGMLLRNFLWRLKSRYLVVDFHPLVLFYLFGVASAFVGVLSGLWSLLTAARTREEDPDSSGGGSRTRDALTSAALALFGGVSVAFAMLLDMRDNEALEDRIYE
ncbi:glycosyltransferase family 2 protein [Natrinema sp. LN54]|uniref:glycosyltransferase family 2 protein n=1 Tax=Natrinema sp. LN54 TaxID=3458705 RepID=UPI0040354DC4